LLNATIDTSDKALQCQDGISTNNWLSSTTIRIISSLFVDDSMIYTPGELPRNDSDLTNWRPFAARHSHTQRPVLIPLCVFQNHWVLLRLDYEHRTATLYDSLSSHDTTTLVRRAAHKIADTMFGVNEWHRRNWTFKASSRSLQQPNSDDCGIYVLFVMLFSIARPSPRLDDLPATINSTLWRYIFGECYAQASNGFTDEVPSLCAAPVTIAEFVPESTVTHHDAILAPRDLLGDLVGSQAAYQVTTEGGIATKQKVIGKRNGAIAAYQACGIERELADEVQAAQRSLMAAERALEALISQRPKREQGRASLDRVRNRLDAWYWQSRYGGHG
jgi:hypothetical protein